MLKDRFEYLVDRLYRAGLRNNAAESKHERAQALLWLALWNKAIRNEYKTIILGKKIAK
jgi:hypothetical protein